MAPFINSWNCKLSEDLKISSKSSLPGNKSRGFTIDYEKFKTEFLLKPEISMFFL